MRKIFLDCGAHIGESVRYFRKHYDPDHEYEVFCFEPLPENIEKLKQIEGVTVIEAAVSYFYGKTLLYTGLTQSGSLYQEKRTGGLDGKTNLLVKTIALSEWLEANILHSSAPYVPEIIIKLNVEGEEYNIINDMDQMGILPFIKRWFVNWHHTKCGISQETHDRIIGLIEWETWKAMLE